MIHHKSHIFLRKIIEASIASVNICKHSPYQFMIDFDSPLLIRLAGITIKDSCSDLTGFPVTFDCNRIGELAPIVSQDQRKYLFETLDTYPFL